MNPIARWLGAALLALLATTAAAQPYEPATYEPAYAPQPQVRELFTQPELDQVLAPIALYPDQLLSHILVAATFPRDVAEAAAWSRANPQLQGQDAVRAVQNEPWDPSVMALVAFPQVLQMMDDRRDWTERLGDAFLAQQEQVMDTVQVLRRRADEAGTLHGSGEIVVERRSDYYVIEPASPEVVYVPYYDPRVAYGDWWWPDYQPVYWSAWPGYSYYPGYAGFSWGYGITLGSGFFLGAFDWPRRSLFYASHRPWYWQGRDFRRGHRWTNWRDRHRGDRGHRWRDGHRADGRGDGRWRDRDGRGDRDGRHDRWRGRGDRDARPDATRVANPSAGPGVARGERQWRGRSPDAPRYRADGGSTRVSRAPPAAAVHQPASGLSRPVELMPRAPQAQAQPRQAPPARREYRQAPQYQVRQAPAPQVRQAPAPQVREAPAPRVREAPAPRVREAAPRSPISRPSAMQRSAPRAAVQRASPAPRAARSSAPSRSSGPSRSSPPSRGSGLQRQNR